MGRVFLQYLEGKHFSCKHCKTHLAYTDEIASTVFTLNGEAYLFHEVVNVFLGEKEDRMMETGMHTVADIYCVQCYNMLGWKYEHAEEATNSFRIGKFLIERIHMLDPEGNDGDIQPSDDEDDDPEEFDVIV